MNLHRRWLAVRLHSCTPYSGWRGVKVALDFRFGHGMIPEALYKRIYAACDAWHALRPPRSAAGAPGLSRAAGLRLRSLHGRLTACSPLPHLRRDWARRCHICAGTGLTPPFHICAGTRVLPRWGDLPFPAQPDMYDEPPAACRDLLEDPVRPCLSVAGDT